MYVFNLLSKSRNMKYKTLKNLRIDDWMIFNFFPHSLGYVSRDISAGTALGYRLDNRGSRVRFPVGAGNSSLHHRVQNGSGAHPASYPMGTRGSFPGCKAAGA
jgi:hypothetical protein